EHGFTVNAVLEYCWHKQMNIYGSVGKTVVGMTVSGRNLDIKGIEESVGLYINTLPLIVEHREGKVVDSIREVQAHINEANSRSGVSLSKLQKDGERLFSSLFVYENYPIPDGILGGELDVSFGGGFDKTDYPLLI